MGAASRSMAGAPHLTRAGWNFRARFPCFYNRQREEKHAVKSPKHSQPVPGKGVGLDILLKVLEERMEKQARSPLALRGDAKARRDAIRARRRKRPIMC